MRWKASEIIWLQLNYNHENISKQKFIKRNKKAIYEKSRRLNINRKIPNWTNEEIDILITNGAKKASEILNNKSYTACKVKLHRLMKNQ